MGVEREKKLPASKISQLETRVKRGTDHVRHVENRKDGKVHERFGGKRLPRNIVVAKYNNYYRTNPETVRADRKTSLAVIQKTTILQYCPRLYINIIIVTRLLNLFYYSPYGCVYNGVLDIGIL